MSVLGLFSKHSNKRVGHVLNQLCFLLTCSALRDLDIYTSMLNTPPVFAVYVAMLTLRWLKEQGGVAAIEKINHEKAELLYTTLEKIPFINLPVAKENRSKMNVVFTMKDEQLEKDFLQACKDNSMYGVKGHRSVGGFRISLYNALQMDSLQAMVSLINDFAQKQG